MWCSGMGEKKDGLVILRERRVKSVSDIESPRRRGRPAKWKDRVEDYMHERGADREGEIEQARKE